MDFIERFFGLSPDGGDGSTEALYLIAFLAIATIGFARPIRRRLAARRRARS